MKYQTVLFDLDGTLTDPGIGITNSVAYALEKSGADVPERTSLYRFIGPPLLESFQRFCGFSEEEARQAIRYYREYFQEKGIWENRVYDGMEEFLEGLRDSGRMLLVATSKPEPFARQIMEHYHLAEYFAYVGGSGLDETRTDKAEVIAYVLEVAGVTDKSHALMVGDREHDIIGAKKNGLDSAGVLYGYGSREELEAAGADYIADSLESLKEIISH